MCHIYYLLLVSIFRLAYVVHVSNCDQIVKYNYKTDSSECYHRFQRLNNGCYYYSDFEMNFDEAAAYCENLGNGYLHDITLAMLDYDREEDEAVLGVVAAKYNTFWVGGKTEDGKLWCWLDDREVYYYASFWQAEEPNEIDNKCMIAKIEHDDVDADDGEVYPLYFNRAYIYDHNCSDRLHFICQVSKVFNCPKNFININNYCYLQSWIIGVPNLKWKASRDYCRSLTMIGGYHADLAVLGLEGQDDYRLMKDLMNTAPSSDVWIGAFEFEVQGHVQSNRENCHYQWIDGRLLSDKSIYWHTCNPYTCKQRYRYVALSYKQGDKRPSIHNEEYFPSSPFICQIFKND